MAGLTYQQIALRLGVSQTTIRSHMQDVTKRLGIVGRGRSHLFALMLARGWAIPDDLLADYEGPAYAPTHNPRMPRSWLPSPAWRLYLDAYQRLLEERTASAAADVAYFLGVVSRAHGVSVPERGRDVDAMLKRVGARICTPEQRRLLAHF